MRGYAEPLYFYPPITFNYQAIGKVADQQHWWPISSIGSCAVPVAEESAAVNTENSLPALITELVEARPLPPSQQLLNTCGISVTGTRAEPQWCPFPKYND